MSVPTGIINIGVLQTTGTSTMTMTASLITTGPPNPYKVPNTIVSSSTFLSDSIIGTTDYTNANSSYVDSLILLNESNGSTLLPRIIGYNIQLGGFDDALAYGDQQAYLSLSTPSPHSTLRWQGNGNLAIYDFPENAPTWQTNTQSSNRHLKKDITPLKNCLQKIRSINGVKFSYKTSGLHDAGVIAQEVKDIIPEAVYGSEETSYEVYLEKLIPHLVGALQEIYRLQKSKLSLLTPQ